MFPLLSPTYNWVLRACVGSLLVTAPVDTWVLDCYSVAARHQTLREIDYAPKCYKKSPTDSDYHSITPDSRSNLIKRSCVQMLDTYQKLFSRTKTQFQTTLKLGLNYRITICCRIILVTTVNMQNYLQLHLYHSYFLANPIILIL